MEEEIILKNPYGFIYITTNLVNGKRYIGQRIFDNAYRWKSYIGSGLHFKRAVKRYGKENFIRNIIDITYSKEESDEKEKQYIKFFSAVESDNFYNIAYGGQDTTTYIKRKISDETRAKLSNARKGQLHWNYGKHLSDETKEKISKAHKGLKASDNARRNMSISQTGRKHTNESKLKMSIVQSGHKGLDYSQNDKRYLSKIKGGDEILQFNLEGVYLDKYVSMHDASNKTNVSRANIKRCCDYIYKQSNGFIWLYNQEYISKGVSLVDEIVYKINNTNSNATKYKPVIQYDKNQNFINKYESITAASVILGIHKGSISDCCKGKVHCHTAGGYIWKYAE